MDLWSLYALLGREVECPKGRGVLQQVFTGRANVVVPMHYPVAEPDQRSCAVGQGMGHQPGALQAREGGIRVVGRSLQSFCR